MSGKPYHYQIDMRVKATEPDHVTRLSDVLDLLDAKIKNPVDLMLSVPFVGTYSSAAKTLTQTTPAQLTIDGVIPAVGNRILVNGQSDSTQNGIYVLTTQGVASTTAAVLTRAEDFDSSVEIFEGVRVYVAKGDTHGHTTWKLTGTGPFTLDTSNLIFIQDIVKYTEMREEVFEIVGDASTLEFTKTHNFGTWYVDFFLYDATTKSDVSALITRTSVNDVKVTIGVPLGTGNNLVLVARAVITPV